MAKESLGIECPHCKEDKVDGTTNLEINEKNLAKFKDIQNSKKYMGHEMLSLICIKCDTTQRKGLNTFNHNLIMPRSF